MDTTTTTGLADRILYRDGWVLVIDKPAGVPVHRGPGEGPHVEIRRHDLCFGLKQLPELAHRLDRLTSGCLVLGRHRQALRRLGTLFAAGLVEKCYWAVVTGKPPQDHGRIDAPLRPEGNNAQTTHNRGWRMEIHPDGQPSCTDFRVLGGFGDLTWLELHPLTGRTHQIRVHCAHMGCPVVGDPLYGFARMAGSGASCLQLHARSITIPLYQDQQPITVVAPPPRHMLPLLIACGHVQTCFS
ncbi:MAG: RluA family pseudouridine synthase [Magnetococcales bacterium]|nr:RluA family pseudouridine synthase [Magnetococcales bacterium]